IYGQKTAVTISLLFIVVFGTLLMASQERVPLQRGSKESPNLLREYGYDFSKLKAAMSVGGSLRQVPGGPDPLYDSSPPGKPSYHSTTQ
ncbi:unnamed protein product, partial [Ilex paraguariensis]